ncbi:MAG: choice-of-anchor R domain-containing protein [Nitrososphaerota archaeon]
MSPVSASVSDSVSAINILGTSNAVSIYSDYSRRAQQFLTPNKSGLVLNRVGIFLSKYGSPTGTLYARLYSNDNNFPGSPIATLGAVDVSTLPTASSEIIFTPLAAPSLNPNTLYWISVEYSGGNASNYVRILQTTSDVAPSYYSAYYTTTWNRENNDYNMNIYLALTFSSTWTVNLDYQYTGTATRRLEDTGSKTNVIINSITVNGVNVGTTLEKTDIIPQSTSYQITYNYSVDRKSSYSLTATIQRYLLYEKTMITLDDLGVSEAYLAKIKFYTASSVLRIDGNPDSELIGNANEVITFDKEIPFRKLEWIQGSGEAWIIGVE